MLEKHLQSKIKKDLEKQGWKVLRPVAVSKSGYPDLWCLKNGVTVFVEVKLPGKDLSRLQERRHNELKAIGFYAFTAKGLFNMDTCLLVADHYKNSSVPKLIAIA